MNLLEQLTEVLNWVPLKRYLELYGETRNTVYLRISRGQWKQGVHWNKPEGAGIWLSLHGINAWAATEQADISLTKLREISQPPPDTHCAE